MDHRGCVLSFEAAAFEQLDLAAATFFCRGADHRQCQADVVDDGRKCERGPDGDRRDEVVAAGMPEAGKCVIFGTQRDVQVATADLCCERGVEAAVPIGDAESVVRQLAGDPPGGPEFLPGGFRVVVQIPRQRYQTRVSRGDTFGDRGVDARHWSPGTP